VASAADKFDKEQISHSRPAGRWQHEPKHVVSKKPDMKKI